MNVLVACEFSGRVRDAFTKRGHYAVSCDLLPSETEGHHIRGDVREILDENWDLVIAHPPCRFLCVSGNRWRGGEWRKNQEDLAVEFFMMFSGCAERVCIENPVGIMSTLWRPPDQYIQPWMFGDLQTKKTGLWLEGLEPLEPFWTAVNPNWVGHGIHMASPGPERWKERSRTFKGIAEAMAIQWG